MVNVRANLFCRESRDEDACSLEINNLEIACKNRNKIKLIAILFKNVYTKYIQMREVI